MALSEITSPLRTCRDLEGSFVTHESKSRSENFVICRPSAKAEVICLSIHDDVQPWSSGSCGSLRRRLNEPVLHERRTPISSGCVCGVKRVTIALTDMLAFAF